jgi:hypothetical protein
MLEIPTDFESLTPEWLSEALTASGVCGNVWVTSRSIEIIGEGQGFAGRIARIRLDYADSMDVGPASVIAKLPATIPRNRATVE